MKLLSHSVHIIITTSPEIFEFFSFLATSKAPSAQNSCFRKILVKILEK